MSIQIDCFKAYDIRGRIPDQLNSDIAYRVANATAAYLGAKRVVLGRDIRQSSDELADAVAKGLIDAGVEVLDVVKRLHVVPKVHVSEDCRENDR